MIVDANRSHMSESDSDNDLHPISVEARSENTTKTTVEARGFEMVVDEPEEMGGTDEGPNPLEYLLGAEAGCLSVTAYVVARDMDIDVNDLEIEIEGGFNPAVNLGETTDERAGLQHADVTIKADTDADDEILQTWIEQVEQRCPVTDNLQNSTPLDISVS